MIVVVGCGRSGTNMVLEILAGNSALSPSKKVEDKEFFEGGSHDDDYLTKCDCVYFNVGMFNGMLSGNPKLKIVWTMRDPRDMILSKIKRGQPKKAGGDNRTLSKDGTPEGCIQNIEAMMVKYRNAVKNHPGQIYLVKMEDFLRDLEGATKRLCVELGLSYEPAMLDFMSRMRNAYKVKRYKGVDKGELEKWRDWQNCYGGFFVKGDYDIPFLFEKVAPLVEELGYATS